MKRPHNLPDFDTPPLTEVIVGLQFTPISNFKIVDFAKIYDLFADEFPKIEEHQPLEPRIETFGGTSSSSQFALNIGPPPIRPRVWFVSEEGDHLVQFQEDRLLLNWRKRTECDSYPRFEGVLEKFENCLMKLKSFATSVGDQMIATQSEVTYANIIPVSEFSDIGQFLNIAQQYSDKINSLAVNSEEILLSNEGKPVARFYVELNSVYTRDGKEKAYRLHLTVRGRPHPESEQTISQFMLDGRRKIVETFDQISTDEAKKIWGKK